MNYAYQVPRRVTVSGTTRPASSPQELPTGDLLREVCVTERQRVINEVLDALGRIATTERDTYTSYRDRDRSAAAALKDAKAAVKALGAES